MNTKTQDVNVENPKREKNHGRKEYKRLVGNNLELVFAYRRLQQSFDSLTHSLTHSLSVITTASTTITLQTHT